jgi:hypothetical protein
LFLAGRQADAARAFESAMNSVPDSVADYALPSLLFNYGKTLALAKDPRSARYLDEYLTYDEDDRSEWRREAIALLGRGSVPSATPTARPSTNTRSGPPPTIAGVKLGDSPAAVIRVLGKADDTAAVEAGVLWHYQSRGLVVGVDPKAGVAFIALMTPSAGDIEGVRVGDTVPAARAKLGNPSDVQQDSMIFDRGSWLLHIEIDAGVITMIGITGSQ